MPLAFGGRIWTLDTVDQFIANGADKVVINSGAYRTPSLITEVAHKYGSQAMVAAALYIGGTALLGGLVRRSYQKQSRSHADLLSLAQEALLSIRVVKAFCTERYEVHRMKAKLQDLIKEQVRGDLLSNQVPTALTQVMGIGAIILVALSGLRAVTAGELTQQGLVMFLVASVGMLATTAIAAQAMISTYILSACAGRIMEMLRLKPTITDGWRDFPGLERGSSSRTSSSATERGRSCAIPT
jgi:ABC-type multidrug transport system fused ATPase/permease subunit